MKIDLVRQQWPHDRSHCVKVHPNLVLQEGPLSSLTILYSPIQFCTILCSVVQYCRVLYSTVQYLRSAVQYCKVLYSIVQYCTVLSNSVQYCTLLCNIVQYWDTCYRKVQKGTLLQNQVWVHFYTVASVVNPLVSGGVKFHGKLTSTTEATV